MFFPDPFYYPLFYSSPPLTFPHYLIHSTSSPFPCFSPYLIYLYITPWFSIFLSLSVFLSTLLHLNVYMQPTCTDPMFPWPSLPYPSHPTPQVEKTRSNSADVLDGRGPGSGSRAAFSLPTSPTRRPPTLPTTPTTSHSSSPSTKASSPPQASGEPLTLRPSRHAN